MKKRNGYMRLLPVLITLFGLSVLLAACGDKNKGMVFFPKTYSISGSVSGDIKQGVDIVVSGAVSKSVLTDADGNYSVSGLRKGSYTVTPSKAGYAFSPVSIAVTISAGNKSIAAFTSTIDDSVKYNLTGTVSGDTQADVIINVTGPASGSAATLADGTYTIPNLPNGTYTVSASKPGYTFSADRSVTIFAANSSGNDFTATAVLYSISGTVGGELQEGVTLTVNGTTESGASFGPVETTTSGNGSYSMPDVPNGDYTVAAAKTGYTFYPGSYAVTITLGNSPDWNFTALMNPVLAFRASGGTGTSGYGGDGGQFYAESYGGSIKVLKSGTVDASFTVTPITPNFGTNPFVVSSGTTTVALDDPNDGQPHLYAKSSDAYLYSGNGDGNATNDPAVTGLTINAGATLVLVDQMGWGYGSLQLDNNLLVNGTLTSDLSSDSGLYVEANLVEVGSTGKMTASATVPDGSGGEINLGWGNGLTKTIINRGMIEAKGDGTGTGGYIYFEPDDLVVNYGRIDVSGGSTGGSGGEFDAYVDYGDFYSSGTVRMNGGNGDTGGETEYYNGYWYGYSCWIETAYLGNTNGRNGDIIISGTWEAKGGDGANGDGGSGGYLYFQTDGIGTVTVNAYMSAKGGTGSGANSGGTAGEIDFSSYLDYYGNGGYNDPTPGKISIAGTYDLRGGNGDQNGGSGGYLYVYSDGVNSSDVGSNIEFAGFPVLSINGGEGGVNGGSANSYAFGLYTYSSGPNNAKAITNEAELQAKGGNATLAGGTGGMGGAVYMQTGNPGDAATVLSNSGNIDVSGGGGDADGGSAFNYWEAIYLDAQHVDNSGILTANGGYGTTGTGGDGGNITLISEDGATPTVTTDTLSVAGGTGTPAGADGVKTVDGSPI